MTSEEIIERLERLERENRMLKRLGFAMLLGVASLIVLAAQRPRSTPRGDGTRQIVVHDPVTGNRAVLDGDGLTLYDVSGKIRVELREGKTGPKGFEDFPGDWLKLYDDTGRPGVELTEQVPPADFLQGFAKEQSTGNLVLLDYEGGNVSAANLGVGKATGLWLTKTRLKRGQEWPASDDVDAALMIDGGSAGVQVQEHGDPRIGLFASRGMPGLSLEDDAGYATQIGVADMKYQDSGETLRTSAASIVMLGNDKEHHVIWRAP
ncbi:MAG TPA: hypothetical protein VGS02_21205 [Acidobacteriaceae bacterium]|nr:hypothetical protein [Acidobacteriaceae bacterium]